MANYWTPYWGSSNTTQRAQAPGSHQSNHQTARPHSAQPGVGMRHGKDDKHIYKADQVERLILEVEQLKTQKSTDDQYMENIKQQLKQRKHEVNTLVDENEKHKETIKRLQEQLRATDDDSVTKRHVPDAWCKPEDSAEMRNIKDIMGTLNGKIEDLEQKYLTQIDQLQNELASSKSFGAEKVDPSYEIEQYKNELGKAKDDYQTLKAEARSCIKELRSEQQQYELTVTKLRTENEELSNRLSEEMNVKVSADESNMENISISNRPMKVAESYNIFFSSEWLELKNSLDEYIDKTHSRYSTVKDSDIFKLLCDVLLVAHEEAMKIFQSAIERVFHVLQNPVKKYASSNSHKPQVSCPQQLSNALGDFLRISSDSVDLKDLETSIHQRLKTLSHTIDAMCAYGDQRKSMQKFIQGAASLAWKMVNQRPVMVFLKVEAREKFDSTVQEPYWGSADPSSGSAVVDRCVIPALFQGDRVMVKAKVLLKYDTRHYNAESDV